MKVFISVDMEGISGVVNWNQTSYGKEDYERFRRLMTQEANAAIEGAFSAGAREVLVNDSHGGMRNLIIEDLNPEAQLITGSPKPMSMMEGLDSGFDAVLFVGYHSMASSFGVLNHTYSTRVLHYWVNDKMMGETGMNALIAGYYGVPCVFLSGDSEVCKEAQELLGAIEVCPVKTPRSKFSAQCLHPKKAQALIRKGVEKALANLTAYKPFTPPVPSVVKLQFQTSGEAAGASLMPETRLIDPLTVEYVGRDYLQAYRGVRTMISLAYGGE